MLHRPFCRRLLHRSHVNDLSAIRLHSSPFESMPSNLTHRQHAITGSRATAHTKFRLRTKFFNVLFDRNAQGPYCVSSQYGQRNSLWLDPNGSNFKDFFVSCFALEPYATTTTTTTEKIDHWRFVRPIWCDGEEEKVNDDRNLNLQSHPCVCMIIFMESAKG